MAACEPSAAYRAATHGPDEFQSARCAVKYTCSRKRRRLEATGIGPMGSVLADWDSVFESLRCLPLNDAEQRLAHERGVGRSPSPDFPE